MEIEEEEKRDFFPVHCEVGPRAATSFSSHFYSCVCVDCLITGFGIKFL